MACYKASSQLDTAILSTGRRTEDTTLSLEEKSGICQNTMTSEA